MRPLVYLILFMTTIGSTEQTFATDSFVVPKIIYHHGKREFLMEDISVNTVPEEAWQTAVVGSGSPWPPERRGLYGSEQPEIAEAFTKFPSQRPWFMAITLKDECRTKDSVASSYKDVLAYPTAEYRVVVDTAGPRSWYIRDRNCIEKLTGTAEEMLQMMTSLPDYWNEKSRKETFFRQYSEGENLYFTLLLALENEKTLTTQQLEELREAVRTSDLKYQKADPYWLRSKSDTLLKGFIMCQRNGALSRLQKGLTAISDSFFNSSGNHQNFDEVITATITYTEQTCN
jgi:hypothetical protein